jgi:hypothetical protein
LGKYLKVEFLDSMVSVCLSFKDIIVYLNNCIASLFLIYL